MSASYRLYCKETNQAVWIGQGSPNMRVFYSGEKHTMERLGRFFSETAGKELVLLDDHQLSEINYEDFE